MDKAVIVGHGIIHDGGVGDVILMTHPSLAPVNGVMRLVVVGIN